MDKETKGLSLIEGAMVLALAAVVVAGVLYYYSASKANSQIEQTSSFIVNIAAKLQALYANQPPSNYAGLSNPNVGTTIIKATFPGVLYKTITGRDGEDHSGLTNTSIPGVIRISGSGPDQYVPEGPYFLIQFWFEQSLSKSSVFDLCTSVLGREWGNSVYGLQVNNGGAADIMPPTSASKKTILEKCATSNVTAFTLFFK